MPARPHSTLRQALTLADQHLQRRDIAAAERVLAPYSGFDVHHEVLGMIGAIRLYQGQFAEAAQLLTAARAVVPRDPMLALNMARALAGLGRVAEAQATFSDAIRMKPDFAEARFDLGHLLHRTGKLEEAENVFRQLLRIEPGNIHAKLALGAVLVDAGRPQDAEFVLRRGLDEAQEPSLKMQFWLQLSTALRRQRKDQEALAACDNAAAIDSTQSSIALHRAEALQNLGRHEEALEILGGLLAKAPGDAELHHSYNDLLYRLGRKDELLNSYNRAPQTRPLLLGKAFFLSQQQRYAECLSIYEGMLVKDPSDVTAAIGVAKALGMLKRYDEASKMFDRLLVIRPRDAALFSLAAEPAMLAADPQKAAWLCEQGLALAPHNLSCLANLGTAWRMMNDERDEALNRYDTLIRSFDLEPPEGFSDMASFNAELDAALNRLHPGTREFIGQSLRGGTQTPDHLFAMSHRLVANLQARISEVVESYIADLGEDATHPFLSRRGKSFRYTGSWSSRLHDCGFHVNHIHPEGWISSCYYVAVPDAAKDETARQGWIKFGEPRLDVMLSKPVRRAIQPIEGRLVLFPSYTWHGTIPFRDTTARTTIAFDVAPRP